MNECAYLWFSIGYLLYEKFELLRQCLHAKRYCQKIFIKL